LIASQRAFGKSLPIGRDDFANRVAQASLKTPPKKPRLASFEEIDRPLSAKSPPSVDDVSDHLILGFTKQEYLVRDIEQKKSDYRVRRTVTEDLYEHTSKPGNIGIVTGSVCTGKSLLALETMLAARRERHVFRLRLAYSNVCDEVRAITSHWKDCIICIEECFMLGEQLTEIAEIVDGTNSSLLLTSRDVAYDTAADGLIVAASNSEDRLKRFPLSKMDDREINEFVSISERIAGWGDLAGKSHLTKAKYVQNRCHSNLAEALLHLLKSQEIKDKLDEVYFSCISTSPKIRDPFILALYLQHIGLPVQLEVLSTLLEIDVGALLNKPSEAPKFEIIRRDGHFVRTLSSIGAREILYRIVDDREIVRVVTTVVKSLSENRRYGQTYTHIFNQFMRYPLLQGVVISHSEINDFFDQLSLHPWIKKQSHFWLQFSMAKTDFGEYSKAKRFLENAYGIASEHTTRSGELGHRQLDDQKAKFLLKSRTKSDEFSDYFVVLRDAMQIINRILDSGHVTFHVFDTISLLCDFIHERFPQDFDISQYEVVKRSLAGMAIKSKNRAANLTEFHEINRAQNTNEKMDRLMEELGIELQNDSRQGRA
jgi:hypothetical protein